MVDEEQLNEDKNKTSSVNSFKKHVFLKISFIYLFLKRGEGKEKEKKRETNINVWLPLVCPLMETWTLWSTGLYSIRWATPARAKKFNHPVFHYFFLLAQVCFHTVTVFTFILRSPAGAEMGPLPGAFIGMQTPLGETEHKTVSSA